jgi:general stress protein YciG
MKGVSFMETNTSTRNRGFASMDIHRQRELARKGGRAAHEKGRAHEFTAEEARAAGRKGGEKVSVNRRHMAEIGRRGGKSSAQRRRPQDQTQNPSERSGERSAGHESAAPAHSHQPFHQESLSHADATAQAPEVGTEQE